MTVHREKCSSMSESLVGDWNPVGVLETACSNHNDVNEEPNTASANSDEFEDSCSNLSGVEVVYAQSAEEN